MSLSSGLPGVSSSCESDVAWREARQSLSLKLPRKDCTLGDCLWRPGEEMRPNISYVEIGWFHNRVSNYT
jgi:hypothetical protein